MADKLIKSFTIGEDTCKVDYNSLENKPFTAAESAALKRALPVSVELDHTVTAYTKKGKISAIAYPDEHISAVEVYRYACPEHIDIDTKFKDNVQINDPETHLSYLKDSRPMYARDGDFGFPEIDGTGQFNFKPIFTAPGYVLVPAVRDSNDIPHDEDNNPCYNNFKTPWLTGIDGAYRFTKICKDIKINLQAVLESELETNTVSYNLYAPEAYEGGIPSITLFRCEDQVEKHFKYGAGAINPPAHPVLSNDIINGSALTFEKQTTAAGESQHWTASSISYNDATGYPTATDGVVWLVLDNSAVTEGYTVTVTSFTSLSTGKYPDTKALKGISNDVAVTITIAPPVDITYNDGDHTLSYVDGSKTKIVYGFSTDAKEIPSSCAMGSDLTFGLTVSETDTAHGGYGWYLDESVEPNVMYKGADTTAAVATNADVLPYIDSITIGGTEITVADAIKNVVWKNKKVIVVLDGQYITGDVVITLAARPGERSWPTE